MKKSSIRIVGLLNILIFQWFFIRIALGEDTNIKGCTCVRRPLYLLKWVVPLSGFFGMKFYPKNYKTILLYHGLDVVYN